MSTINIHEYPTDDEIIPHYRAAVMLAAADGAHVEYANPGESGWYRTGYPAWDWTSYLYRIAAPKIAKGHNPDGLSESQVEVKDGWRLLERAEIGEHRTEPTKDIQALDRDKWSEIAYYGAYEDYTYRTKKPEGYFLPKPEVPLAELDYETCMKSMQEDHAPTLTSSLGSAFVCGWNAALKYERSRAK